MFAWLVNKIRWRVKAKRLVQTWAIDPVSGVVLRQILKNNGVRLGLVDFFAFMSKLEEAEIVRPLAGKSHDGHNQRWYETVKK